VARCGTARLAAWGEHSKNTLRRNSAALARD
jgi:hypothetical protein